MYFLACAGLLAIYFFIASILNIHIGIIFSTIVVVLLGLFTNKIVFSKDK